MKTIGIGAGTFIGGFIICTILAILFSSGDANMSSSYLGFIGFSILYLSSVIAVCTALIMKKLHR